jgi:hypothetical protein
MPFHLRTVIQEEVREGFSRAAGATMLSSTRLLYICKITYVIITAATQEGKEEVRGSKL